VFVRHQLHEVAQRQAAHDLDG